jgi:hypothetical protein
MSNPVEQRKAVRESIDGVLTKVRDHHLIHLITLRSCFLSLSDYIHISFMMHLSTTNSLFSQITELETLITDFDGDNPALNAKL